MTKRLPGTVFPLIALGILLFPPNNASPQTVHPDDIYWDAQMPMRLCVLHNFDNLCGPPFPHLNCRPQVQNGASGVKVGAIVQGPSGDDNFYGASPAGGKYSAGTIFMLTPANAGRGRNTNDRTKPRI
ncbi:MAG: hypothetical protein ABSG32_20655 [Terriglobia bacterium]